jgi:hypothetical protein
VSKHSITHTVTSVEAMQPRRAPRGNQLIHIIGHRFRRHPLVSVCHNNLDRGAIHGPAERQWINLGL